MSTKNVVKKQNECLNFLKGISCFGILYMHTGYDCMISSIISCIVRFAVPLFFMISGYYIYNSNRQIVAQKLPKKTKHIFKMTAFSMILYLIWDGMISPILFGGTIDFIGYLEKIFSWDKVWKLIIFNQWGILWFLFALLYCYLILIPINKYDWYGKAYISIPILLLILIFGRGIIQYFELIPEDVNIIYFRNFIFMGFPFFMTGNLIHKYEKQILSKIGRHNMVMIVVAGIAISCVERYIVVLELFVGTLIATFYMFIYALKNQDNKVIALIAKIGKEYSMAMYIGHPIVNGLLIWLAGLVGIQTNKIFLILKPLIIFLVIPMIVLLFNKTHKRLRNIK